MSPAFVVDSDYDTLEFTWHGGISHKTHGRENLAIRLIAAKTGEILQKITPPGSHVPTTHSVSTEDLRGKEVSPELVDKNAAGAYAWIGLQKMMLLQEEN